MYEGNTLPISERHATSLDAAIFLLNGARALSAISRSEHITGAGGSIVFYVPRGDKDTRYAIYAIEAQARQEYGETVPSILVFEEVG